MSCTPPAQRFPVRIWLISFLGWMFDFYDLILFSFLLIPIGHDLKLSEAQEAVLLGVALGASGIGGILFGYLSDRYGRKRVMTWTIGLYSLGTALTAFSTGPVTLLIFRLLTGLGVGGEWAVGHALVQEASPSHMRGRAAAFLQAGEPERAIAATRQALALVQAQGLPLEKFVEAMRVNASYSGTLAMKLPKMLERDFAPHFSVKHMLKDMQIASQMALSHYLDLGVTAAARDQLFEQMQWGRGDEDYSAVLRKYLHEPTPGYSEESQIQESPEESNVEESITALETSEEKSVEPQEPGIVASPEPALSFSSTVNVATPATAPLRRGFIKQLLSRFSSGEE